MRLHMNSKIILLIFFGMTAHLFAEELPRVRDIMSIEPTHHLRLADGTLEYGYLTKSRGEFLDVNWTKNGGFIGANVRVEGWEKNGKLVLKKASIGPNAHVWGTVTLEGKVKISDNAQVYGNARVSGLLSTPARVYGNAFVYGNAHVHGARIYDRAQVFGNARISWEARVFGKALVAENGDISEFGV